MGADLLETIASLGSFGTGLIFALKLFGLELKAGRHVSRRESAHTYEKPSTDWSDNSLTTVTVASPGVILVRSAPLNPQSLFAASLTRHVGDLRPGSRCAD
jgi:hypothetical protein